jgi:hypothetical protein
MRQEKQIQKIMINLKKRKSGSKEMEDGIKPSKVKIGTKQIFVSDFFLSIFPSSFVCSFRRQTQRWPTGGLANFSEAACPNC